MEMVSKPCQVIKVYPILVHSIIEEKKFENTGSQIGHTKKKYLKKKFLKDWAQESILPNFFFLRFFLFGIKLGHFSTNNFFSVCNKNASLKSKNRKIPR